MRAKDSGKLRGHVGDLERVLDVRAGRWRLYRSLISSFLWVGFTAVICPRPQGLPFRTALRSQLAFEDIDRIVSILLTKS